MTDVALVMVILLIMMAVAVTADLACNANSDRPDIECYVDLKPWKWN